MTRVLIADDHDLVRAGIRSLLARDSSITIVGETGSAADTLSFFSKHPDSVDVLLLDLSFPDSNGLDVLLSLRKSHPTVQVVVLTMHPEDQFGLRSLQAGASGYLTKKSIPTVLLDAVKAVARGDQYLSPELSREILSHLQSPAGGSLHERLSNREYQVFCLLAAGHPVSKIAEKVHLSVKSISTYRTRILEKMSMTTNADLTQYAIRHKLI